MKQDLLPYLERVAEALRNVGYAHSDGTTPGFSVQSPGGNEIRVVYVVKPEFAETGQMFEHWLRILMRFFRNDYKIEFHTNAQMCPSKWNRTHIHMTPRW